MQIGELVRTIVVELGPPVEQTNLESEPELTPSPAPIRVRANAGYGMSSPGLISPILGYRVWTWDDTGLKSFCGERWHPGQAFAARCKASTVVGSITGRTEVANEIHDAPKVNCTCGFYAAKTFAHFRNWGYERYGIHGEVYLWGKVVEHDLGYRAQFAYPRYFVLPPDLQPFSSRPIQDRLRGLIAYRVNIFVADDRGNVPLWTKDSGLSLAGLGYLTEIGKYFHRGQREGALKKGDSLAVQGRGTATVVQADGVWVHAAVLNKCVLRVARSSIWWNGVYRRWETSPSACVETKGKVGRIRGIPSSG